MTFRDSTIDNACWEDMRLSAGIGLSCEEKERAFGVPSDSILEVDDRGDHDLIVLGSRWLGKVECFLLGSVSDYVSHKAKHSILIFRAKCE